MTNNRVKIIPGSEDSYDLLKEITDLAQAGKLKPWGKPVIDLITGYGIQVDRKKGTKAEITLSFPTSTENRSMAIGVRHLKDDQSFAEDLYIFEEKVGLKCYYRGSQETVLPEYAGTHHAKIELKEALPDIQQEINNLKRGIAEKDIFNSIPTSEIVTGADHVRRMKTVQDEFNRQVQSVQSRFGNSSAPQAFALAAKPKFDNERAELQSKWSASNRLYDLKKKQLEDLYAEDEEGLNAALERLDSLFGKQD